jgi:hypothetical protein
MLAAHLLADPSSFANFFRRISPPGGELNGIRAAATFWPANDQLGVR